MAAWHFAHWRLLECGDKQLLHANIRSSIQWRMLHGTANPKLQTDSELGY